VTGTRSARFAPRALFVTLLIVVLPAVLGPLVALAGAAPSGTLTTVPASATRKLPITLDASGITGATQMRYLQADGLWTEWLPFAAQMPWTLTAPDGPKAIQAEFSDGVDPPYQTSVQISLDRKRPTTQGYAGEVKRGQIATLYYRVKDPKPSCRQATVQLAVYRFGKLKTTFKLGVQRTNIKLSRAFTCRWDRGWYTYKVLATDIAGNKHVRPPGVGVLFVK
jgi:hypothetical protein